MKWLKLVLLMALVFVLASCTLFPKGVVVPPIDNGPGPNDPIDDPDESGEWEIQSWTHAIAYNRYAGFLAADVDLVVTDISENRNFDLYSANEIAALKSSGSGKKVLAWVPGNAHSSSGDRWTDHQAKLQAADLIDSGTSVKYWEDAWLDFLMDEFIDPALEAGFDGAILDNVTGSSAQRTQFIIDFSERVKSVDPNFKVFHYNGTGHLWNTYGDATSGINQEYLDAIDGVIVWASSISAGLETDLEHLKEYEAQGKIALAGLYNNTEAVRNDACDLFEDYDFNGYVSNSNNDLGSMCDAL